MFVFIIGWMSNNWTYQIIHQARSGRWTLEGWHVAAENNVILSVKYIQISKFFKFKSQIVLYKSKECTIKWVIPIMKQLKCLIHILVVTKRVKKNQLHHVKSINYIYQTQIKLLESWSLASLRRDSFLNH